ncbi:MAG: hypothetical protein LJU34_09405 [Oscillospiraceae bacterium]|nr:hypothetical protein [Oscillospiraceae bacterium]
MKKTLSPPMGGLARFSYRFRYGLAAAFLVMFVGFYFAQQQTETAYTLESEDEIADIFPSESTLVLVYENQDEDAVALLAETLSENDSVTQVLGYPNLLGKEYTAAELLDAVDDLSDTFGMETDMDMDETMLGLIYYMYYDGAVGALDMESFLTFLSEEVLESDSFGDMIDEDLSAQGEKLARFSSAEELTRSRTVQELADFLDMDADTVQSLLLYYYTQHGGAETGSMTLKTFADFVVDEVAADPDYRDLFDADTLSELEQLQAYTDADAVTTGLSYTGMADALGLDSGTTRLLYVYYFATQGGYTPGSMTISEFVRFVQEDVLTDSTFSSYFDSDTAAQLETLALYTDADAITQQYTAAELASVMGMEESLVQTVYALYTAGDVSDKTMTLGDFTSYLTSGVLDSALLSGSVDDATAAQLSSLSALIQAAAGGQTLTASELAALLGMDETTAAQLLSLYAMEQVSEENIANTALTVTEFAAFLTESVLTNESYASQFSAEEAAQIQSLYALLQAGASGQAYTAAELAAMTGMDEAAVGQLLSTSASGEAQDTETAEEGETETTETAADAESEAEETAANTETETTETTTDAETEPETEPTMTLPDFLTFVVEGFSDTLDEGTLTQLTQMQALISLAQSGQTLNGEALAQTFGMEFVQTEQILRLYLAQGEQTAALADFTAWLTGTLLEDETYAALFDDSAAAQLTQMNQLVQLAASGAALTPAAMAQALGLEEETADLVFQLYYGQADSTMSL